MNAKGVKRCLIAIFGIVLIISLMGCQLRTGNTKKESAQVSQKKASYQQSNRPTLFVHGYSGGPGSFRTMIKRLAKSGAVSQGLIVSVTSDGEVEAEGDLTSQENNPTVQVIFEDSRSHEWNQTDWIKNVLAYLKENYGVTEVNFVGHSMGGVSGLRYLITYSQEQALPAIKKFVAIGSPFNNFEEQGDLSLAQLIATGPEIISDRYADYRNGISVVPKTIEFLIIAGDLGDGSASDESVLLTDALSPISLLKAHGNPVTYEIFEGADAQHSALHENKAVDQAVATFLFAPQK